MEENIAECVNNDIIGIKEEAGVNDEKDQSDSSHEPTSETTSSPESTSSGSWSEPKLVTINRFFKSSLKSRWSLKLRGRHIQLPAKRQRSYSEMDIYSSRIKPDHSIGSQRPLTSPASNGHTIPANKSFEIISQIYTSKVQTKADITTDYGLITECNMGASLLAFPAALVSPAAAAVVVEPPSSSITPPGSQDRTEGSSEGGDEDRLNHNLLTASSGNFASLPHSGSGLGPARSAPNTPLQDPPGNQPPAHPNQHPAPIQASPHRHHSGHKHESGLKQLSQSAPSVSANGAANATSAAAAETAAAAAVRKPPSQPSKARQKKFLRHFPQVSPDERVLNYYSCALVGDILLQGHLYITKNYFAFYSNVFGYVTKLLIPTASVLRVSKEKMARIIPNAVGVVTDDERHVFGSLLSRDSTYRLMLQVWKEAAIMHRVVPPEGKELRVSEAELDASEYSMDEDSSSGAEGHAGAIIRAPGEASAKGDGAIAGSQVTTGDTRRRKTLPVEAVLLRKSSSVRKTSHTNSSGGALGRIFAAGAAALLALLAVMAGVLIWRLLNHPSITATALEDRLQTMTREDMYTEILRWQNQLHRKSANEVNGFLETNLDQIAKVRQSLEALSAIMVTDRQDKIGHHEELSSPTDQADQKTGLDNFKS